MSFVDFVVGFADFAQRRAGAKGICLLSGSGNDFLYKASRKNKLLMGLIGGFNWDGPHPKSRSVGDNFALIMMIFKLDGSNCQCLSLVSGVDQNDRIQACREMFSEDDMADLLTLAEGVPGFLVKDHKKKPLH